VISKHLGTTDLDHTAGVAKLAEHDSHIRRISGILEPRTHVDWISQVFQCRHSTERIFLTFNSSGKKEIDKYFFPNWTKISKDSNAAHEPQFVHFCYITLKGRIMK
jgi:hypothetical protein